MLIEQAQHTNGISQVYLPKLVLNKSFQTLFYFYRQSGGLSLLKKFQGLWYDMRKHVS